MAVAGTGAVVGVPWQGERLVEKYLNELIRLRLLLGLPTTAPEYEDFKARRLSR